jgi:hypothetical protein
MRYARDHLPNMDFISISLLRSSLPFQGLASKRDLGGKSGGGWYLVTCHGYKTRATQDRPAILRDLDSRQTAFMK